MFSRIIRFTRKPYVVTSYVDEYGRGWVCVHVRTRIPFVYYTNMLLECDPDCIEAVAKTAIDDYVNMMECVSRDIATL